MEENCLQQAGYNRKGYNIFANKIEKGDIIFLKWVIQKKKDTKYMVLDLWSKNTAKMSR